MLTTLSVTVGGGNSFEVTNTLFHFHIAITVLCGSITRPWHTKRLLLPFSSQMLVCVKWHLVAINCPTLKIKISKHFKITALKSYNHLHQTVKIAHRRWRFLSHTTFSMSLCTQSRPPYLRENSATLPLAWNSASHAESRHSDQFASGSRTPRVFQLSFTRALPEG